MFGTVQAGIARRMNVEKAQPIANEQPPSYARFARSYDHSRGHRKFYGRGRSRRLQCRFLGRGGEGKRFLLHGSVCHYFGMLSHHTRFCRTRIAREEFDGI